MNLIVKESAGEQFMLSIIGQIVALIGIEAGEDLTPSSLREIVAALSLVFFKFLCVDGCFQGISQHNVVFNLLVGKEICGEFKEERLEE
jgi:hypothetical protein